MAKKIAKTIQDGRKPNSNWRLGRAAKWFAKRLGLPRRAVVFRLPNGRRARTDKTLGALRGDWKM